jgi:hypothetical protein
VKETVAPATGCPLRSTTDVIDINIKIKSYKTIRKKDLNDIMRIFTKIQSCPKVV